MIALLSLLPLALVPSAARASDPPVRVVSMNLCTDQTALILARPGQLVSVSELAADPAVSVLATAAAAIPSNGARAEEISLLHPDLVLAGTYSNRATIDMLRRLGYRVEEFAPTQSFADIRAGLLRMGDLLGREDRARDLIEAFDTGLAALAERDPAARRPVGVMYYPGGRTDGRGTFFDEIMVAAGWRNLASDLGMEGSGVLSLERLVMRRPDAVIVGTSEFDGPALAQEYRRHPALSALIDEGTTVASLPDPWTICGGPFTLDAVARLVALRRGLAPARSATR